MVVSLPHKLIKVFTRYHGDILHGIVKIIQIIFAIT